MQQGAVSSAAGARRPRRPLRRNLRLFAAPHAMLLLSRLQSHLIINFLIYRVRFSRIDLIRAQRILDLAQVGAGQLLSVPGVVCRAPSSRDSSQIPMAKSPRTDQSIPRPWLRLATSCWKVLFFPTSCWGSLPSNLANSYISRQDDPAWSEANAPTQLVPP